MKEYVKNKIYKLLKDIDSSNFDWSVQENETLAELFGGIPGRKNDLVVNLKIVELVVGTEQIFGVEIKKDFRNIAFMKPKDFVDYVFYMT